MTDKEIIKALECCRDYDCKNCTVDDCKDPLHQAFDLINRQQAEIERLKKENAVQSKIIDERAESIINHDSVIGVLHKEIERLRYNLEAVLNERADHSEAIKEFAERLKDSFSHKSDFYAFWGIEKRINNLVKEMVGGTE